MTSLESQEKAPLDGDYRVDELRAALTHELTLEVLDYQRIADLSALIGQADPTNARFSVDAGMISRLGRELVVRHETALSELVKNAYDADAREVRVHIARLGYGNFIQIDDDGVGMTREELTQGFMRLATTVKLEQPTSPLYGRRRAGKKGVGRFAAERLGHKLVLTTAVMNATEALRLEIEWDRFAAGSDLGSVSFPVTRVPKEKPEGTTLRIERLRDSWPPSAIERTFRHVAHLIDPGDQTADALGGSNFSVRFEVDGRTFSVVDVRSEIGAYAYAVIEGVIDGQGNVSYGMKCQRLGINFSDRPLRMGAEESSEVTHARNVTLKARYFILDRANIASTAYSTVLAFLSNQGGINIYRNGFRVPPYGQSGNDWLALDQLSSRRTQTLAPIRNRNFLGSVSILDEQALFEETSSREGLIESDAVNEMVGVIQSILLTSVREIDAERERQKLKRDRPPLNSRLQTIQPEPPSSTVAQNLRRAVAEAKALFVGAATSATSGTGADATFRHLEQLVEDVHVKETERNALVKEIDLLRVLASMGLAIGQFTHEFSTLSGAMRADLAVLLETGRAEEERKTAIDSLRALLDQARSFSGLFKAMTEENALRDRQPIDLYESITSFKSSLRSILDRNGVDFEVRDDGDEIITPPMHRSELFAILLNFTTNSIKAVKRARRRGRIEVRLKKTSSGSAMLEFLDNGDGVAPEVKDTLFDAFVTTTAATANAAADEELALGSGLGLTIVRDIVVAIGGSVSLAEGEGDLVTCFRVEFPLMT